MSDILFELVRAIISGVILTYLFLVGRNGKIREINGWYYIFWGFAFIFMGTLLDVTDNFSVLNSLIIVGDTVTEAFLEKIVGYLLGFVLLAVGLVRWLPSILKMQQTEAELKQYREKLEAMVAQRIEELNQSNQKLLKKIIENKETEDALDREKRFSDDIVNSLPGIFYMFNEEGKLIRWNKKLEEVSGYSAEELSRMHGIDFFIDRDKELIGRKMQEVFVKGEAAAEAVHLTKHDEKIPYYLTGLQSTLGGKKYLMGVGINIAERKILEEQLRHAQKMEAIGTLTGGISHEFNNILSAIIGFSEIVQEEMGKTHPLRKYVDMINEAAHRGSYLTKGLLTFTRKQITDMKPVLLNEAIKKSEDFLSKLMGVDIKIKMTLSDSNIKIMADSNQIEQVLVNLAANARDAMPHGGILTISTEICTINEKFIAAKGLGKQGTYALLKVKDCGTGMDEKTKEKIFEPFFTTKDIGKGTGLGLSMVYGIVEKHNGYIDVITTPDVGTTFEIYLPVMEKAESN